MRIARVDPRDQRWEVSQPTYRVCFWRNQDPGMSEEFEVVDARSVHDVLRWADEQTSDGPLGGWLPEVWVRVDDQVDGVGLVRLAGPDPAA